MTIGVPVIGKLFPDLNLGRSEVYAWVRLFPRPNPPKGASIFSALAELQEERNTPTKQHREPSGNGFYLGSSGFECLEATKSLKLERKRFRSPDVKV